MWRDSICVAIEPLRDLGDGTLGWLHGRRNTLGCGQNSSGSNMIASNFVAALYRGNRKHDGLFRSRASKNLSTRRFRRGRAIRVLLSLQCLVTLARADVSNQELQQWVDKSALIFQGTILSPGSNVNGIDTNDDPMIVRVDGLMLGNDTAVHNFGSLVGKELTVVDPLRSGPERKPGTSAIFFVNPLLYEKNIAVTVTASADDQTVNDLSTRLTQAIEAKRKKPFNNAENSVDSIVTGVVEEIRLLPDAKIDRLRKLANGYDLYSEHAPRWREAVIRVRTVDKGKADPKLLVVFPTTDDRAWAQSPRFTVGQAGTWLLHSDSRGTTQFSADRASILLVAEAFDGGQLKVYTALLPQDFRTNDSAAKNKH